MENQMQMRIKKFLARENIPNFMKLLRRVSIAIALVHDPELLILDEPTVGVDPLLRESIWNHLVKLVTAGRTTVIITTHYVEEARQSNVVGLRLAVAIRCLYLIDTYCMIVRIPYFDRLE